MMYCTSCIICQVNTYIFVFIIFRELDEKRNVKHRLVNSLKEDVAVQEKIDSLLKQITQFCEDFQKDYDLFQKYVRFITL